MHNCNNRTYHPNDIEHIKTHTNKTKQRQQSIKQTIQNNNNNNQTHIN